MACLFFPFPFFFFFRDLVFVALVLSASFFFPFFFFFRSKGDSDNLAQLRGLVSL